MCLCEKLNKDYVIICLYVDDMLILASNEHMIKSTKKVLTNKFHTKNLGVAEVILKIKISTTSNGLVLFNLIMLRKFSIQFPKGDNSIVKTPININVHMSKNRGKGIN
jgi:hypothetical protein